MSFTTGVNFIAYAVFKQNFIILLWALVFLLNRVHRNLIRNVSNSVNLQIGQNPAETVRFYKINLKIHFALIKEEEGHCLRVTVTVVQVLTIWIVKAHKQLQVLLKKSFWISKIKDEM